MFDSVDQGSVSSFPKSRIWLILYRVINIDWGPSVSYMFFDLSLFFLAFCDIYISN